MKRDRLTINNFRDFGGLTTADGHVFKSGKLYRTSALAPKTDADRKLIDSLKLDCVIDFRTDREIGERPDVLPAGVEYIPASVFGGTIFIAIAPTKSAKLKLLFCSDKKLAQIKQGIIDSYAYMPYAHAAYSKMFDAMNSGKNFAFHCTAGKDRTGVAAIMIELALGRTIEQARSEYLASNNYRANDNRKKMKLLKILPKRILDVVVFASHTYDILFDNAIEAIFGKYHTIEEFLLSEYGVTAENISDWKRFYLSSL